MQKIMIFCLVAMMQIVAQAQCSVNITASNDSLTCIVTTSTLTANAAGGTTPYTYLWSTGQSSSTELVTTSGVFTVTITDAIGCTATSTKTIGQDVTHINSNIQVRFTNIVQNGNCNNLATATAVPTGGTQPYQNYAWNNGVTTPTFQVYPQQQGIATNTYTVTVSDNNGCIGTGSISLTTDGGTYYFTNLISTPASFSCGIDSVTLSIDTLRAGFTYDWSVAGVPQNTQSIRIPYNPRIGYYVVTVTNAAGCISSSSIMVQNTGSLAAGAIDSYPPNCGGSIRSMNATVIGNDIGLTYLWHDGSTQAFFNSNQAGTYAVTVTNAAGCSVSMSTTLLAVTPPPVFSISFSNPINPTCNNNNGSITVTGTGGTQPYSFYVYNSSGNYYQPDPNGLFTNLSAGTYTVTATDANFCSATASFTLVGEVTIVASTVTQPNCNNNNQGAISLIVTGINPPFTATWSDGGTGLNRTMLDLNGYYVTVTSSTGCSTTASFYLYNFQPLLANEINQNVYRSDCNANNTGSASVYPNNNASNIQYNWSNGSTFNYISGLASGWYSVTMTQVGCDTIHRNIFVPQVCKTTISGYVINDVNHNCIKDNNEVGLGYDSWVIVQNTDTGFGYVYGTDYTGYYSVTIDTGHYHIYTQNGTPCIALLNTCNISNLFVYANNPSLTYNNNNFYYTATNTNQHELGIYGYQQTARPAFPRQFSLHYENRNATATNASITFSHDSDWANLTMLQGATPTTSTPTSKTWSLGTLSSNSSNILTFTMELPQNTPIGLLLNYTASITADDSDCNYSNNITSWSNEVTNSFDPNDKTLLNTQDAQGNILNDNAPLHYQIRFQNTGTDTAYSVVVRDTFDLTHLDKNTFKIIGASHNMQTEWVANNIVEFRFPNIYLVDSFHNEPLSHGWLQFSISRKPNTPLYSHVNNSAAIVFDYNDAVITNTVHTQFVPFLSTENNVINTKINLDIQPNPTTGIFNLTHSGFGTIKITDILGKTLLSQISNGFNIPVDIGNLPAGTYFITLTTKEGNITKKIIKI